MFSTRNNRNKLIKRQESIHNRMKTQHKTELPTKTILEGVVHPVINHH